MNYTRLDQQGTSHDKELKLMHRRYNQMRDRAKKAEAEIAKMKRAPRLSPGKREEFALMAARVEEAEGAWRMLEDEIGTLRKFIKRVPEIIASGRNARNALKLYDDTRHELWQMGWRLQDLVVEAAERAMASDPNPFVVHDTILPPPRAQDDTLAAGFSELSDDF